MTRAILIALLALILVSCGPTTPEAITAQNNAPGSISQAEAERLAAISAFMDAAAARERAKQPDYGWVWPVLFIIGLFVAICVSGVAFVLYNTAERKKQEAPRPNVTYVTNNYLVPFVVTPRGRIMPLDNGARTLEAGHDVTQELAKITKPKSAKVRK